MKSATDDITEKGTAPIKGIRPSNPNYKPIDRQAFREANPDFYAKRRASSAVHDYYINRAKTGSAGNEIFEADAFHSQLACCCYVFGQVVGKDTLLRL